MSRLQVLLAALMAPVLAAEVRLPFRTSDGRADSLTIDRILFDANAPATEPRVGQLAPGVTECVAESQLAGEWSFAIADNSAYYGFGERFDRLNHAFDSQERVDGRGRG
jgi:hypothetical protein